MKLSGLAVPSCCCGSSHREAILVCQASTILPLGTTFPAARATRTNGIASAVVARPAVRNIVRRVTFVFSIFFLQCSKTLAVPSPELRHPSGSGSSADATALGPWVPAFAGTTRSGVTAFF